MRAWQSDNCSESHGNELDIPTYSILTYLQTPWLITYTKAPKHEIPHPKQFTVIPEMKPIFQYTVSHNILNILKWSFVGKSFYIKAFLIF